jgi:hypothetical protein
LGGSRAAIAGDDLADCEKRLLELERIELGMAKDPPQAFRRFTDRRDACRAAFDAAVAGPAPSPHTLVSAARFLRVEDLLAVADPGTHTPVDTLSGVAAMPPGHRRALELVDRALAADSALAEAHFWKARILGTSVTYRRREELVEEPADLARARSEAASAVALAPGDPIYRRAAALYEALAGDDARAAALLGAGPAEGVEGRNNRTLAACFSAWAGMPIPAGARRISSTESTLAQFLAEGASAVDRVLPAPPWLLVRVWSVDGPVDSVLARFAEAFPGTNWSAGAADSTGERRVRRILSWPGETPARAWNDEEDEATWFVTGKGRVAVTCTEHAEPNEFVRSRLHTEARTVTEISCLLDPRGP